MNALATSPARVELGADDRRFMHAVIRRIVKHDGDADDVTQDALLCAVRHRDQFRGESHYRTWLYRIAWTSAIQHLRRTRRQLAGGDAAAEREVEDPAGSPEAQLGGRELAAMIDREIDRLPPTYREPLRLRLEELSEAEIARRLEISLALVKIRAHRARRQLRASLAAAMAREPGLLPVRLSDG